MGQNISFALGTQQNGVPLNSTISSQLQGAMQGGAGTNAFFQNQILAYNFYVFANSGGAGNVIWSTDTDGNPVFFVAQQGGQAMKDASRVTIKRPAAPGMQVVFENAPGDTSNTMYLVGQPALDNDVVSGQSQPSQFEWQGQSYNIVGTLTMTLSFNETPLWYVEVPLGVASSIPISALAGLAWKGLLLPVLQGFWSGVKSLLAGAARILNGGDVEEVADAAGEEATVTDAAAEGTEDTVSMLAGSVAFGAAAVLVAIPFIVSALSHPSYHTLKIYNLTEYDITWTMAHQDEGAMNLAPSSGSAGQFDFVIPAVSMLAPPGVTPVTAAHEADFGFVATSGFKGIGYALSFSLTNPTTNAQVGTAAVLFDIPWSGSNSLFAVVNTSIGDPASWYKENAGIHQQTQFIAGASPFNVTATYDFLSGEHPAPNGQNTFTYNSVLVFSTPSSTQKRT